MRPMWVERTKAHQAFRYGYITQEELDEAEMFWYLRRGNTKTAAQMAYNRLTTLEFLWNMVEAASLVYPMPQEEWIQPRRLADVSR